MNGNPQRQKGETHAGLSINRDDRLGWRLKATAMPTKREIFRLVSDCPLTIAEQALLWAKKNDWEIKLHPNSLNIKNLLNEVKDHTTLLPPDQNILALAMLIKNFLPPNQQQSEGLPNFQFFMDRIDNGAAERQAETPKRQTSPPAPQPSPAPPRQRAGRGDADSYQWQEGGDTRIPPSRTEWVGDGADKMQKTQERYDKHMKLVNSTLDHNKHNSKKQPPTEPIDTDILDEEIDALLESEDLDFDMDVPSIFASPQEAQKWAMEIGVFENMADAAEAYKEIKTETKPSSAEEMAAHWTTTCIAILGE